MKIGGVQVTEPVDEYLVLSRGTNKLVFIAKSLKDWKEFNESCPRPQAPVRFTKDGKVEETDNKSYQDVLKIYFDRHLAYMVIRSLEPSNIEWDTVDPANPKTWLNWLNDFKNAGLTETECNHVINFVSDVNTLSEKKLKESRESFLLGQALVQAASSGLRTEPESTQSGEPVAASE